MATTDGWVSTPLGERLRADRLAAGLSQRQAAARIETTTQSLSGWENGKHKPSDEYLARLAELLGQDLIEYVRLRMRSPASGRAGQRARRYRAQIAERARADGADREAAGAVEEAARRALEAKPGGAAGEARPGPGGRTGKPPTRP